MHRLCFAVNVSLPKFLGLVAAVVVLLLLSVVVALAQASRDGSYQFVTMFEGDGYQPYGPIPDPGESVYLLGHPNRRGPYLMRLTFAAGSLGRPHCHSRDRLVRVIRGTFRVKIGSQAAYFDPEDLLQVSQGGAAYHPQGTLHYDGSYGGPVTVEISGMGPVRRIPESNALWDVSDLGDLVNQCYAAAKAPH